MILDFFHPGSVDPPVVFLPRPKIAIVDMPDYYHYAMGVIVMTMYSVAIFTGYEIYDEADDGYVEYLLSLPITRRELVLGRSLAGGLRSFIFMSRIIAGFLLLMVGVFDPWKVLAWELQV
jgi:ABC-2 type transport system permease protein